MKLAWTFPMGLATLLLALAASAQTPPDTPPAPATPAVTTPAPATPATEAPAPVPPPPAPIAEPAPTPPPAPATPPVPAVPAPAATPEKKPEAVKTTDKKDDEVPDSVAVLTGGTSGGERKSPFGGLVILEQDLGIGTFVSDANARNPYYGWLLSIRPRYYFTKQLSAELRIDLQQELTNSYGTATTKKRQLMPSDTLLTVRYQNAYKEPYSGIAISPFIRLAAPTSYESAYRDLYIAAAAGFDLTRMLGPVFLDYTFRFNKNFNRYTIATVKSDKDAPIAVARTKGNEELAGNLIASGVNNMSFSVYNSLNATYIINDQWSVSLVFAILNSWTYNSFPKDDLAADAAKGGRGRKDTMYGTVDLSYQPWANVGFSLGLSSIQPPKTEDNKSFRFPFFDFRSEANNFTNIYFDVYATY
jgi:hypothetical protein